MKWHLMRDMSWRPFSLDLDCRRLMTFDNHDKAMATLNRVLRDRTPGHYFITSDDPRRWGADA